MSWWRELKRRNVVRVAIAYAVAAWVLLQLALILFDIFGAPDWVSKVFVSILLLCFPIALIFAWAFELTPAGIKRTHEVDPAASITIRTGRKLNYMITAALAVAVIFLGLDRFMRPAAEPAAMLDAGPALTNATDAVNTASIAVLPFADMSPQRDQEYFADGISEELLNLLARLNGVKVAARTSSFAFKGRNETIKEIADMLGVANVLEGSVRKAGTTLRITAQLIDAESGYHLWSDAYDRELEDVFAIQDEIAAAIVAALKESLGLDTTAPTTLRSDSVDAYGAYLEGRYLIEKRTQQALEQAAAAFEKTIALDPDYAPAYAALAETTILLSDRPGSYGDIPDAEVIARAEPLVERALALAPDTADAQVASGFLLNQKEDLEGAIAAYDRALAMNPNMVRAHFWRANALHPLGRYQEQMESLERAVALDPLSFVAVSNWSGLLVYGGRVDEARQAVDKLVRVRDDTRSYYAMANLYENQGHWDEAHPWLVKALQKTPGDRPTERSLMFLYASLGLHDKAAEVAAPGWESVWVQSVSGDHVAAAAAMQELADKYGADILHQLAAMMYLRADDPAAARQNLEPLAERTHGHEGPLFAAWAFPAAINLAEARQKTGDTSGADQLLRELTEFLAKTRATGISGAQLELNEAQTFALSGNKNKALQSLRSMVDSGFVSGFSLNEYGAFESLRGEPEFERIAADYEREIDRQRIAVLQELGETSESDGKGGGLRF